MAPELVTRTDIAARWRVSPEAVDAWRRKPGFPPPLGVYKRRLFWDGEAVDVWVKPRRTIVRMPPARRLDEAPQAPHGAAPLPVGSGTDQR